MESSVMQFWVDILGSTWGTHFCVFYQTKDDLLDILIPYFKAGLENNEFCMWVTSEPLNEKDAEKAMRAAIPNFDKYLQKNQIEIIPYTEWYVENNEFDSQRVLKGWVDKCKYALDNGFKGLRLTRNSFWLEDKDWKDFTDYEEEVNNVISSYNMIAVCTYSLEKCGSIEILDVVRNHQYALFRREGSWEIFKSSEQTKIERKLKESEVKLSGIMNSITDQVCVLDRNLKILYINSVTEEIYGPSALGSKCYQLFHSLDEPCSDCHVSETFEDGEVHHKECIRRIGEESRYCWCVSNVFERDEEERPISVVEVSRDITDRKKIEQELKESEHQYRTIINYLRDPMHVIDKNYKIILVNKALEQWVKDLNMDQELIGKTPIEAWSFLPDFAMEEYCSIFNDGNPIITIGSVIINNREITTETRKIPIFEKEEITQIITIIRDITESKEIERRLKESEEKYRTLFESSVDGIACADMEGYIIDVNKAFLDMLGFSKEELLKLTIRQITPSKWHEMEDNLMITQLSEERGSGVYEKEYIKKNGTIIPINVRFWIVKDDQGDPIMTWAIVRDITERKKAEEEITNLAKFPSENPYPILRVNMNNVIYINSAGKNLLKMDDGDKIPDFLKGKIMEAFTNNSIADEEIDVNNRIYLFNITPVLESNYVNIYGMDITERKKLEEILKVSEHRLKEAQALGKIGYWEFDITSQQITWSDQVFEIYNRDPSLGPPSVEEETAYYTPEINEMLKVYSGRAIKFGEEFDYDLQANLPSGMVVQLTALMRTIKNSSGQVIKLVGTVQDITERKQVEQKLKESEARYKNLSDEIGMILDHIPALVFYKDTQNRFLRVNKSVADAYNLSKEELVGKSLFDLYPEEEAQAYWDDDLEVIKSGKSKLNFEESWDTVEGKKWVSTSKIPFIDEKGIISGIIGFSSDITERKMTEQKLKESEEKYRMGFKSSTDGIASTDMEGTFLDFNNAFLDMLGYSREDLLKLNFREITPQRWWEMEDNMIESQLADGKDSGIYEKEYIRKDGTMIPINIRFWIIKDDQGDPVRMWKIVRDITKRKKAEEEIRLQSEIFENISEGVYLIKLDDGTIVFTNPTFEEMFGYNPGEMIGKDISIVNAPTDKTPKETKEEIMEILKEVGEWHGEVLNVKKDGTQFWCYANVSLFDHPEYGTVIVAVHTDVTERIKAEEEKMNLTKLKSEFLRRASHELKTPLISIKGFSDLILALHKDQINPDIISKLNEINQGCERLQNIINNLLTTSRLESPDIKPKVKREDLTFLLKYCVHELQSLAQTRNQSINLDIQDGQYAIFEKEEIHDVISNLLTNAIKYTPPDGKIDVRMDIQEENVVISIKDNGIGFTNFEKTKIFQQFGKIERYGQGLDLGIDGTGLGLYISKRIVESHGGTIWMESEGKNQGSTFYFSLPLIKD